MCSAKLLYSIAVACCLHAVACGCFSNQAQFIVPMLACYAKPSSSKARLRHAVACDCFCNQAHFIVPMLACYMQSQASLQHAVAGCYMPLLCNRPFHSAYAGLRYARQSFLTAKLWHAVSLWHALACGYSCNEAQLVVPMLACYMRSRTPSQHSCDMQCTRLLLQSISFQNAYVGLLNARPSSFTA